MQFSLRYSFQVDTPLAQAAVLRLPLFGSREFRGSPLRKRKTRVCDPRFSLLMSWLPTRTAIASAAAIAAASATAAGTPTAASAAEPSAASATTAAKSAISFGTRFVHRQLTSIQSAAVQLCHSRFGFGVVRHLDKGKTARLAAVAVAHDVDIVHGSELRKRCPQTIFVGLETHIAYINIFHRHLVI
jgi:hypothetical protein